MRSGAARAGSRLSWSCCARASRGRSATRWAGAGDPVQRRLTELRPLDAWGDVWHALTRLQDETERLHLDRRQAVISGIAMLNGAMLNGS